MPSSSYKVNNSPSPQHRVKIDEPKNKINPTLEEEDEEPEASTSDPKNESGSDSSTSHGHSTSDSTKRLTNGHAMANGKSNGHVVANGKPSGNGILKNKESDVVNSKVQTEERWRQNYVPCAERQKHMNGDIVKHVSEIFEDVFKESRENWSNKIEFVASCLGLTIGISSFWRFPWLIHSYGGGAFLFCYALLLCLVGLPLFYMEQGLGQFTQLGCVQAWRCAPLMQGVGVAMMVLSLITSIYNSQIVAYVVHYFFSSFVNLEGAVLWGECRSSWEACHDSSSDIICSSLNFTSIDPNDCWGESVSSSKYYWQNRILRITPLLEPGKTGPIHWDLALCLLFVWFFSFIFLMKGVKTSGKVALFTGVVPYCVLIAFLVASLNKPGALLGLQTFYNPDWDMLLRPDVWQKAMEQVILSLGVTYGGVLMISSYSDFWNKRIQVDAISLSLTNLLISVASATTLFAFCGVLAKKIGIEDPKVFMDIDVSGSELLFVLYPDVISRALPLPHVWAIFFFMMLLCLGIHSQFTLIEVCLTTVYDSLPRMRKRKTLVTLCLVVPLFLLSLPLCSSTGHHIFKLLGTAVIAPNVTLIAIFEVFTLFFVYGIRRFCRDLKLIVGKQPSIVWKVLWMFIAPVAMIVLFVFACIDWQRLLYENREDYPEWSLYLVWSIWLLPLAMIPITMIFAFIYKLCIKEPLCQPCHLWGPGCEDVIYSSKSNSDTTSEETIEQNEENNR